MDWAKPKAAMARLAPLDSAAAEVAFFLPLSLVLFVGIAIALAGGWLPVGLSTSMPRWVGSASAWGSLSPSLFCGAPRDSMAR